jgi:hypothetical protein
MSLIDSSISPEKVSGDFIKIRLVPLSAVEKLSGILWSGNAKKHDTRGLYDSIERFGFIDPPHWDSKLNGGSGGIVFGNGRTESIVSALIDARKNGMEPPRGIPMHQNEWWIPVTFGVDQESEAEAIALGIDHNNLTMGSEFSAAEIARMWDEEGYLKLLSSIAEKEISPVSVGAEDLADLLLDVEGVDFGGELNRPIAEQSDEQKEGEGDIDELPESRVRMVQLFLNCDNHPIFMEAVAKLCSLKDFDSLTDCVLQTVCEAVIDE